MQCRVYDEMMRCEDQSPLRAACSAQIWRPQPSLSEVRGRLVCSTAALQHCSVTPDWRQALDTILAVFLAAVSHDAPFRCWNYSVSSVHNLLSLNSPILSITQQSHTLLVREYFKPWLHLQMPRETFGRISKKSWDLFVIFISWCNVFSPDNHCSLTTSSSWWTRAGSGSSWRRGTRRARRTSGSTVSRARARARAELME